MSTPSTIDFRPLSATTARLARQSGAVIERLAMSNSGSDTDSVVNVSVEASNGDRAAVLIPGGMLPLIALLLREVSHGRKVRIVSTDAELSTQEAADILNVSRPYFVKLLRQKDIPYRSVGTRRRVLLNDLLAYRDKKSAARLAGVDELVADSQRLGLY